MNSIETASTGIESLDRITTGLRMGDNVVWQFDDIDDYRAFAVPFAERAMRENRRVVYLRFAGHEPIIGPHQYSVLYTLDAFTGFEDFSARVFQIITNEGVDVFYVFDCLSDLQSMWATDLMIGNFFRVTCPYLFELNTIAYFAILRNRVSFSTIARIRDTTQVLIDVYHTGGTYYVHPLKVWNRYTPTMFFPHLRASDDLIPLTNSVDLTTLMSHILDGDTRASLRNLDYWDLLFLEAEELMNARPDSPEAREMMAKLCSLVIGRDERMLALASGHFTLRDLVEIKNRLIGTGYIGGKSVGMLVSRKILMNANTASFGALLEPHDSFFIGSDVFYTYIVQNGWWRLFMEHKTEEGYYPAAEKLNALMLGGTFPDAIKEKFQQLIDYFGQSPIIVRSSSLLEDAFGNAFAGKYDSFFLVNQGSPAERYRQLIDAIQRVYASTMNVDALTYREQRGLNRMDEQMALLVQRVSGSHCSRYFFPDLAGVGLSYNTYVWKNTLDAKAGMMRIVYGLGTRAVNRVEGDYPRIVALDDPLLKAQAGMYDARKFSQHYADVLNVFKNEIETIPVSDVINNTNEMDLSLIGARDTEAEEMIRRQGRDPEAMWILTFDDIFTRTPLASDMRGILATVADAYGAPVDIEFTINFLGPHEYRINLLQCRPQQTKWHDRVVEMPAAIDDGRVLFRTNGNFLGGSVSMPIRRVIAIDPLRYGELEQTKKYDIARLVGKLNRLIPDTASLPTLLMGPGRWGTTTPALGIPVRFSEINRIAVLVEVAVMRDDFAPELSYGTHFFQDLVETDIFYAAIFPDRDGVRLNSTLLSTRPNLLTALLPDESAYADIVSVYDVDSLRLMADIVSQRLLCFEE